MLPISKSPLIDALVSLRFDLVDAYLEREQLDQTQTFWYILSAAMSAYDSAEFFARPHLRTLIYETFLHSHLRGVVLNPVQHTDIAIFMAPLDGKMTQAILKKYKVRSWSEHAHAIAYHLEWLATSTDTAKAEQTILDASAKLEESEGLMDDALEPRVFLKGFSRIKSFVECALAPADVDLQQKLAQRHWLTLRVKFEVAWRGHVEAKAESVKKWSKAVREDATTLLAAISTLALHFNELEYVWYWGERSTLTDQWRIMLLAIKACRLGALSSDSKIWIARGWVLYRKVLEYPKSKITGSVEYSEFMAEFARFIQETEPTERCLQSLARLYTDMIPYCSPQFFPIPDTVLSPMLEIFEVYVLHKFYKSRRGSVFSKARFFTPEKFVTLLGICTIAGFLDEFNILNRDILMAKDQDDEFVAHVKKGYSLLINSAMAAGEADAAEADTELPVQSKLRFDAETLSRLKSLLEKYLI
ncbi:hypothetical protein HDU91_006544 [Kappamyces sp. JEL0680]|nr:hypothetical protein HDU91_006544 [Kappamyces sp. JEL0680]